MAAGCEENRLAPTPGNPRTHLRAGPLQRAPSCVREAQKWKPSGWESSFPLKISEPPHSLREDGGISPPPPHEDVRLSFQDEDEDHKLESSGF